MGMVLVYTIDLASDVIHSSVDQSASSILWPWVRIPSTTSTLFQFVIEVLCEKDEINKKRSGHALIKKVSDA